MNIDHHDTFQRMIDDSLAGVLVAEKEHSLREHLSTCATCSEYLSSSNRDLATIVKLEDGQITVQMDAKAEAVTVRWKIGRVQDRIMQRVLAQDRFCQRDEITESE